MRIIASLLIVIMAAAGCSGPEARPLPTAPSAVVATSPPTTSVGATASVASEVTDLAPASSAMQEPPIGLMPEDTWIPDCRGHLDDLLKEERFRALLRILHRLLAQQPLLPGNQQQLRELTEYLMKQKPSYCDNPEWWELLRQPVKEPVREPKPVTDPDCEYRFVPTPTEVGVGVGVGVGCYVIWKVCKVAAGTAVGGPIGGAVCLATP